MSERTRLRVRSELTGYRVHPEIDAHFRRDRAQLTLWSFHDRITGFNSEAWGLDRKQIKPEPWHRIQRKPRL